MIPNTEQRIDEHLNDVHIGAQTPVCELAAINSMLDVLEIPRDYPGSEHPCTTRERVNMLVQYCVMRGVTWQPTEEVF